MYLENVGMSGGLEGQAQERGFAESPSKLVGEENGRSEPEHPL